MGGRAFVVNDTAKPVLQSFSDRKNCMFTFLTIKQHNVTMGTRFYVKNGILPSLQQVQNKFKIITSKLSLRVFVYIYN